MEESSRVPAGASARRRERADRILDTAADLLSQHGYKRVTIDDVARQAGVGKGTVYLHWKTREALFWAVLQRESTQMLDGLVAKLSTTPELALPGALMREIFLACAQRPLVRALLLGDPEILGALAKDETVAAAQRELAGNADYLVLLADQGLLRPGLTPKAAGHILGSVMRGFFIAEEDGAEAGPTLLEQADLLADVLKQSLQATPSPTAVTTLASQVVDLFTTITDVQRAQLERAYT